MSSCIDFEIVGVMFHGNLCAGRMIAPVIKNWSEELPHITTYKIDIDEVLLLLPQVSSHILWPWQLKKFIRVYILVHAFLFPLLVLLVVYFFIQGRLFIFDCIQLWRWHIFVFVLKPENTEKKYE